MFETIEKRRNFLEQINDAHRMLKIGQACLSAPLNFYYVTLFMHLPCQHTDKDALDGVVNYCWHISKAVSKFEKIKDLYEKDFKVYKKYSNEFNELKATIYCLPSTLLAYSKHFEMESKYSNLDMTDIIIEMLKNKSKEIKRQLKKFFAPSKAVEKEKGNQKTT